MFPLAPLDIRLVGWQTTRSTTNELEIQYGNLPIESSDKYLVTWTPGDDPENPQNFPGWAKVLIAFQVRQLRAILHSPADRDKILDWLTYFYCYGDLFHIYWWYARSYGDVQLQLSGCSSRAYDLCCWVWPWPSGMKLNQIPKIKNFKLTRENVQVWGPLSEIPLVGRNLVYLPTLVVFVCLQVPTALAGNLGTFLAMRFLGGFIGSPVMAVGAGSVVDVFEQRHLPYVLGIWGSMAALGPLLGPLFGGFAYQNHGWRWTVWVVLWISGFTLLLIFFCLPETYADKLLRDRAARFREQTGDPNWQSESERKSLLTISDIGRIYILRPFELLVLEPIGEFNRMPSLPLDDGRLFSQIFY